MITIRFQKEYFYDFLTVSSFQSENVKELTSRALRRFLLLRIKAKDVSTTRRSLLSPMPNTGHRMGAIFV